MKMMIALICFTAFTGCALDDTGVHSEESQAEESGLLAGSSSDSQATATDGSAAATTAWIICQGSNMQGACIGGPVRLPGLEWFNDTASSIQTNETAMETWNDANFTGTYGYFAPWGTWNSLSSPYNNAISSISYPGA